MSSTRPVAAPRVPDCYVSKFSNWENRASVRTKPARSYVAGESSLVLFPPELVPALRHPLVEAAGPATVDRLLAQSLYNYLNFTVVLEQLAVLPVTSRIALGRSGVTLPAGMRADAYKITTDEAWHAQFCYDFIEQVAERCGVPAALPEQPQFVDRLAVLREGFDPADRELVDLFFATVSETLVSAFLADLPNDKRLPRPVRDLVIDHAEDEGRHHAYFRAFLRFVWPQLGDRERGLLGPCVPELIRVFLEPDSHAIAVSLRDVGFDEAGTATIVEECYHMADDTTRIASAAKATVQSFREVGALDDPETFEAFATRGLVT